jgi:myo-inositol-1(or 4)-monophosphatase
VCTFATGTAASPKLTTKPSRRELLKMMLAFTKLTKTSLLVTALATAFPLFLGQSVVAFSLVGRSPRRNHHHHHHVEPALYAISETWEDIPLEERKEVLATAEEAARAAGHVILSNLGCCSETAGECEIKWSIKDVVTEYDKNAQQAIEDIVRAKYPEHSFLGEEDVDPGGAASEAALENALSSTPSGYVWICDPIDGTANFASGLPLCAVTMGVVYKTIPIVGIIYDPHRNEMFSTIKGQGAWLNGKEPLRVQSAVTETSDAIVNAGCPADPNAFEVSMRGMLALNSKVRGVRVIACSALTLAWIACGRLTAHFGYDLSSWDLVAGALLIQEAGGKITDIDGSPYRVETRSMLCSNGHVHDDILATLSEANATSFTRST